MPYYHHHSSGLGTTARAVPVPTSHGSPHGKTRERGWQALNSAIGLCVLVGALIGVTVHDAEHGFGEDDGPCAACPNAERLDVAAAMSPSIPAPRPAGAIADIRRAHGMVFPRTANQHRPRAPPPDGTTQAGASRHHKSPNGGNP